MRRSSLLDPFWTCSTMTGECLFFIGEAERATATLLFPPGRDVRIASADGTTLYEEGPDYVVDYESGLIDRPLGSRMPFTSRRELYPPLDRFESAMRRRGDAVAGLMSAEGDLFHSRQVAATYSHTHHWKGPVVGFAGAALPRTSGRLATRQALSLGLMGDSISEGYNASGFLGVAPFQPPYGSLVAEGLERAYGSSVAFHNFAVAGSTADNGVWETDSVTSTRPDLVLVAYGMNDAGYADAAHFAACIGRIVDRIRQSTPTAEFILVSSMLPHPEWDYPVMERFAQYRDALAELCGEGVALADLTSLWSALLERKGVYDLSGNGINHPNDFGHRLYAQTILALLVDPTRNL
jgi:acyl-CoA thioesterase I